MKDWNINVNVFTDIGNNISICYKFQNDFNDYFQDKNNKNINENDYDFNNFRNLFNVIFENDNVKNNKIIDFLFNFNDIRDWVFNNNSDINVSLFTGIENNMNVYIVEVPNETAPSIQGFAKPPTWDCRKEKINVSWIV